MITNGTLFRIFWLLLFVRASSLVTDEALYIVCWGNFDLKKLSVGAPPPSLILQKCV